MTVWRPGFYPASTERTVCDEGVEPGGMAGGCAFEDPEIPIWVWQIGAGRLLMPLQGFQSVKDLQPKGSAVLAWPLQDDDVLHPAQLPLGEALTRLQPGGGVAMMDGSGGASPIIKVLASALGDTVRWVEAN